MLDNAWMGIVLVRLMRLPLGLMFVAVTAGCAAKPATEVGYQPPLLPVRFTIDSAGKPTVSGSKELVTPVGTFSIGAKYSLNPIQRDAIRVIIENKMDGDSGSHRIYDVITGEEDFTAVVNGRTTIHVSDRQVLIDVTEGTIERIEFRAVTPIAVETSENWFAAPFTRWNNYWETAFYSPFALSRWAYDDSTIDRWFGIGFIWFLIRLALAIFLGLIDVILLVACFLAALAAMLFGDVARNIVYGIEALLGIFIIVIGGVALRDM
jgi:hypothetical protein